MHEFRLLDRIRLVDKENSRKAGKDPLKMIQSVLGHIQRILNTRQGNVLIAQDYGIPDFTNYENNKAEAGKNIERAIRKTLEKYEPRLTSIHVTSFTDDDEGLTLSFQIQATLVTQNHTLVTFESVVDSGGRVRIKQ
ncbi:MAG: type VI secretion system baseplate subunit TssE [Desulfobacteraceae bacterium]|nr:type VI secretion system baseplate subunit TssE [Desulfobacteraceae bacterium]